MNANWPTLNPPYDEALRQAVAFIQAAVPDLIAIIASGSILRGEGHASSDLDLYVLREKLERQRLQRWFNGVPAEIFINPVVMIERYFADERQAGRPLTAHMLATGVVVVQHDAAVVSALIEQAQQQLAAGPNHSTIQLEMRRYGAATLVEDARDVIDEDETTAAHLLTHALHAILNYYYLSRNQWLPRAKTTLHHLPDDLRAQVEQFYHTPAIPQCLAIVEQLAEAVIGAVGFYAWDMPAETVEE